MATKAELDALAKLTKRHAAARKALATAISSGAPITAPILEFDLSTSLLVAAQVRVNGKDFSKAWATDEALKEAASIQSKAGKSIVNRVMKSARVLHAKKSADPKALEKAINREFSIVSKAVEQEIRAAALSVGVAAELTARASAIEAFGAGAFKQFEDLNIVLGKGIDKKSVDVLWREFGPVWEHNLGSSKKKLVTAAKRMIETGGDARKALDRLASKGLPRSGMTKWADDLTARARAAAEGIPGAKDGFITAAKRARKMALQQKTGKLGMGSTNKKLIADLKKAVAAGEESAVSASVETFLTRRTGYQATSTMRTATNTAYRQATLQTARTSPHIYAIQRILSSSHSRLDYCLIAGTPILTEAGWKAIETIELGDSVMTHRGRWRPVIRLYAREAPARSLVTVRLRVGPDRELELALTDNHRVRSEGGWIAAGDLPVGATVARIDAEHSAFMGRFGVVAVTVSDAPGLVDVFNLGVEEDHSYVAAGVVVSNCDGVASDDIGLGPGVYPMGYVPLEHHAGLCRDEVVIDKSYLKSGRRPLTFKMPPGLEARIASTGAGGKLAKQLDKLGRSGVSATKKQAAMRSALGPKRAKVKLTRMDLDKAPGNSITTPKFSDPPLDLSDE